MMLDRYIAYKLKNKSLTNKAIWWNLEPNAPDKVVGLACFHEPKLKYFSFSPKNNFCLNDILKNNNEVSGQIYGKINKKECFENLSEMFNWTLFSSNTWNKEPENCLFPGVQMFGDNFRVSLLFLVHFLFFKWI